MTISKKAIVYLVGTEIMYVVDDINKRFKDANVKYPKEIFIGDECFSLAQVTSKPKNLEDIDNELKELKRRLCAIEERNKGK